MKGYATPFAFLCRRRFRVAGGSAIVLLIGVFLLCLECVFSIEARSQDSPQATTPAAPAVIKAKVNEVLVPVVVRDAKGSAVGNLSKDDFKVFDNGKPQTITGFTINKRADENLSANTSASSPAGAGSPPASEPL